LGYPTANISVDGIIERAVDGVYAATVNVDGRQYRAVANLGVKPTFSDGGTRVLELHLIDFSGDLYGRTLTAELVKFIRPEQKFSSPEALRAQIALDKREVEKTFNL
jgi:riboflavin kinase/FMN adenylyltransferase